MRHIKYIQNAIYLLLLVSMTIICVGCAPNNAAQPSSTPQQQAESGELSPSPTLSPAEPSQTPADPASIPAGYKQVGDDNLGHIKLPEGFEQLDSTNSNMAEYANESGSVKVSINTIEIPAELSLDQLAAVINQTASEDPAPNSKISDVSVAGTAAKLIEMNMDKQLMKSNYVFKAATGKYMSIVIDHAPSDTKTRDDIVESYVLGQ